MWMQNSRLFFGGGVEFGQYTGPDACMVKARTDGVVTGCRITMDETAGFELLL